MTTFTSLPATRNRRGRIIGRFLPVMLSLFLSILTGCNDLARDATSRWSSVRFKSHAFASECALTFGCKIVYAKRVQARGDDAHMAPPLRPDALKDIHGHAGIRNFPGPAVVTWRSRDGEAHRAEIDVGEIFKREIVLHSTPLAHVVGLEESPIIILVVNDRTIRVYMNARVRLNYEEFDGNPYSKFHDDVTLAFEQKF